MTTLRGTPDLKQYLNFNLVRKDSSKAPAQVGAFTPSPILQPKRMSVSGRRTHALQKLGLVTVSNKVKGRLMEDPVYYGLGIITIDMVVGVPGVLIRNLDFVQFSHLWPLHQNVG
jgi:hypothetical protein